MIYKLINDYKRDVLDVKPFCKSFKELGKGAGFGLILAFAPIVLMIFGFICKWHLWIIYLCVAAMVLGMIIYAISYRNTIKKSRRHSSCTEEINREELFSDIIDLLRKYQIDPTSEKELNQLELRLKEAMKTGNFTVKLYVFAFQAIGFTCIFSKIRDKLLEKAVSSKTSQAFAILALLGIICLILFAYIPPLYLLYDHFVNSQKNYILRFLDDIEDLKTFHNLAVKETENKEGNNRSEKGEC